MKTKQKIILRQYELINEDVFDSRPQYNRKYEDFSVFLSRVTKELNKLGCAYVNYPDKDTAIITYMEE